MRAINSYSEKGDEIEIVVPTSGTQRCSSGTPSAEHLADQWGKWGKEREQEGAIRNMSLKVEGDTLVYSWESVYHYRVMGVDDVLEEIKENDSLALVWNRTAQMYELIWRDD